MKFTLNSADLSARLKKICRVLNTKGPLPILGCVLFQVKDNTLTLTASDGDLSLMTSLVVFDSQDGTVAIESRQLLSAIREIANRPITFDINEQSLDICVNYGTGQYHFVGLPGNEYPLPAAVEAEDATDIESDTIMTGINHTIDAMADDELRPQMNGIYMDDTPTGFTMVASDSHKLNKYTKFGPAKGIPSFILPAKAAKLLKDILKEGELVHLTISSSIFCMENINGYTLIGRKIEGKFPNYNSVIPQGYTQSAIFNRADAISALRRVGVFASQSTSLIKVALTEDGQMIFSAQDIDFRTSAEEQIGVEYGGTAFAMGAHLNYLTTELDALNCESVEMQFATPERAVLMFPIADENTGEEFLQLLMPMKLPE